MNMRIGTLHESSLHAALRSAYSQPGDIPEARVGRYVVDLRRGNQLIEIQTGAFTALRKKLPVLLEEYEVCLVYPIPRERHVMRIANNDGALVSNRKSPKKGRVEELFSELLYIPGCALHKCFRLEVLMVKDEVVWRDDGLGSWRRKKWSVADRKLVAIMERFVFARSSDYLGLLPDGLPGIFAVDELAQAGNLPGRIAQKMVYCLRKMGLLNLVGKRRRSHLYSVNL